MHLSNLRGSGASLEPRRSAWPIAAEQLATVSFLLDSRTHSGLAPGYCETALSHVFWIGPDTYILKRPLTLPYSDWRTPEARWSWCEDQCLEAYSGASGVQLSAVPVVSRNGVLRLGGSGVLEDCVLKRTKTRRETPSPCQETECASRQQQAL